MPDLPGFSARHLPTMHNKPTCPIVVTRYYVIPILAMQRALQILHRLRVDGYLLMDFDPRIVMRDEFPDIVINAVQR